MTAEHVAKHLYTHLRGDAWRTVAELAHPGAATRIDSVAAGVASTAELPVDVAVRLLTELPVTERAQAAHGDTRATILSIEGVAAAPSKDPAAALTKLFSGSADDVEARLAKRSRLHPDAEGAFAAIDVDVASRCAHHVLRCLPHDSAARALDALAQREGAQLISTVATAAAARRDIKTRSATSTALLSVLAAAGIETLGEHSVADELAPWVPSTERRRDLLAAALISRYPVRATAEDMRAVIEHLRDAAVAAGDPITCGAHVEERFGAGVLRSGAAAGLSWDELRELTDLHWPPTAHSNASAQHRRGALNVMYTLARADADERTMAAAATELFADGPYEGRSWGSLEEIARRLPPELDTRLALNILVPDPADSTAVYDTTSGEVFSYLGGRWGQRSDPDVVAGRLAGDDGPAAADGLRWVCNLPLDAYVKLPISAAQSCAPSLEALWDHIVGDDPHVGGTLDTATRSTATAGALASLARRLEDAVAARGAPGDVWAAVCNLADGYDGAVSELVDVAAAVTT